jgi:hypothetical protein
MIFASVSVSQVCGEIQEVLHTKWLPVIVECWGEQQTEIDKLKLIGPEKQNVEIPTQPRTHHDSLPQQ